MAGDPFGLLLRQRIVFLGGEASFISYMNGLICSLCIRSFDGVPDTR